MTTETRITFPCGDLTLEGAIALPDGPGPFAGVVVCHPHPLYGGSMHNNVVNAVSAALAERSITSLTFNFRGVGYSEGAFGDGIGEQEDVRAALTFLAARDGIAPERLGLCGYSFGARVAMSMAPTDDRVKTLAAISPVVSADDSLSAYRRPKLLVTGDRDEFAVASVVQALARKLDGPAECRIFPGADHFWWGFERDLADTVARFFARAFSSSPGP